MFAAGMFSCVLQRCCSILITPNTLRHSFFYSKDVILQERHQPWHPCYAFRSVPDTQRSLTYKGKNHYLAVPQANAGLEWLSELPVCFLPGQVNLRQNCKQLKSEVDLWFPPLYPFLLFRLSPFLLGPTLTLWGRWWKMRSIDVVFSREAFDLNS